MTCPFCREDMTAMQRRPNSAQQLGKSLQADALTQLKDAGSWTSKHARAGRRTLSLRLSRTHDTNGKKVAAFLTSFGELVFSKFAAVCVLLWHNCCWQNCAAAADFCSSLGGSFYCFSCYCCWVLLLLQLLLALLFA